ncbi:MAG TPA: hypothetical protein VHQ65_14185, partial [Thermoanaerobaculia bacterium]|nr:hypothetical protein [Thermoanaerobaculia bacterium]
MQKAMILAMVLALAAVAAPALAEAGCSGAADAPFLAEAAPALATPVVTAKAPGAADQGPLLLSDSCTDQCQQGYRQCLVICSSGPWSAAPGAFAVTTGVASAGAASAR